MSDELVFDPPEFSSEATAKEDPRFGRLLASELSADTRVVLLGFPSDEGVRRNGGRPGAAAGPRALREALYRLTPDPRQHEAHCELLRRTVDLGDLEVSGNVETDQDRLGRAVAEQLEAGRIPAILGGGHETSYGHVLGYVGAGLEVEILNFDAHPDVRPLLDGRGHSGSAFRQALTRPSGLCRGYTVAGLLPWSTASSHIDFLLECGGKAFFGDQLDGSEIERIYAGAGETTMVTFDLDAVEAASAPGVSAPGVGGMAPRLWLDAARRAGERPNVRSFDVVELNPTHDIDGRTARLAALTLWHYLAGIASR